MRTLRCLLLCLALPAALLAQRDQTQGAVTQFSVIDALLAGVYDGPTTVAQLKEAGDFGIGTFNGLDGELLMLDGVVYQIAHDGKVRKAHRSVKTPFATVCQFAGATEAPVRELESFHDFESCWRTLPQSSMIFEDPPTDPRSENDFYALKLTGEFTAIKARSVPKQEKPYQPLAKVVADQNVFNFAEIKGTMVGFYCPPFARGVNVPGWHFHFISKDKKLGGHVLNFTIAKPGRVTAQWLRLDTLSLKLPADRAFAEVDLSPDRKDELEKVERLRGDAANEAK